MFMNGFRKHPPWAQAKGKTEFPDILPIFDPKNLYNDRLPFFKSLSRLLRNNSS